MLTPLPEAFLRLPIAHRALHNAALGRIENSPSAISAAIAAGYGIEIDVQCSRDGVAMVFHDDDLDRLTGNTGLVAARPAAELCQIGLTGGGDCIPTLAEVLALVAGRVPLLIEIKDQTGQMGPSDGALEWAVAADLAGYSGPVAVMSFNPHSVAQMARLAPHVARGLTTSAYDPADWAPLRADICNHLRDIPDFDATGASFISHEAADLARPRVAELRAQGAAILCWTIKSAEAELAARKYAQNITFEQYAAALPA
jgi:glycerophosphoryl diester phosphodiesterase